jgi:hypothetical protein
MRCDAVMQVRAANALTFRASLVGLWNLLVDMQVKVQG